MIQLKSTGKISQAIQELQDAFDRGRPIREGGVESAYDGPRGQLRRNTGSARRKTNSTDSIPRWR
jgi:hypothetical protein